MPKTQVVDAVARRRLGRNIRALRVARGVTNGDLALTCGVSNPLISLIEQGEREPGVALLIQLKLALDVKWDELLDGVLDA